MSQEIRIHKIFLENSEINVSDPITFLEMSEYTGQTEMDCKSENKEIIYNEDEAYLVSLAFRFYTNVDNNPLYNITFVQSGIFSLKGYTDEETKEVLAVDCSQILLPYCRLHAEYMTKSTGLTPILIQEIDFRNGYKNQKS